QASKKLGLDRAVLGQVEKGADRGHDSSKSGTLSKLDAGAVEALLKYGAYDILHGSDEEAKSFCEATIEDILENRSTEMLTDSSTGATSFSKVTFSSAQSGHVDLNAADFWDQVMPDEKAPSKLLERLQEQIDKARLGGG
ncbi:MAG: hypothetical protein MHM6MM_009381, partial [Cercozoa sp. M6MM]